MSKTTDYIISYDIADHKRLGKLARRLEKIAVRIQYSVFYLPKANEEQLFGIIRTIDDIIDMLEDDVRIYTIVEPGISLGQAVDLGEPFLFT